MRPASFDEDLMSEWSDWVLGHGLPELPQVVARGQSVPVAYWAGPQFAAVLHIQRWADGDGDEVNHEIQCFRRVGHAWELADGQDGAGPVDPQLTRIAVADHYVRFDGHFESGGDGWRCAVVDGVVGQRAAWLELTDADSTVRRRVECTDGCRRRLLLLRSPARDDHRPGCRRDRD